MSAAGTGGRVVEEGAGRGGAALGDMDDCATAGPVSAVQADSAIAKEDFLGIPVLVVTQPDSRSPVRQFRKKYAD
jgi:hypothetical protein